MSDPGDGRAAPPSGAAPDLIEPVVGWRCWGVVRDTEGLRLRSLIYETIWPARRALSAVCLKQVILPPGAEGVTRHPAPAAACACGVYAASTLRRATEFIDGYAPTGGIVHRVIGTVALWGSVVEGDRGWRAANAYPRAIFVPQARPGTRDLPAEVIADGLAGYGVPIEILEASVRLEIVGELEERARRAAA